MLYLISFLLGLTCVLAQRPVLNNRAVEEQMLWHNDILTRAGFGLVNVSKPLNIGGLELSRGVQIGMNSLYRTGDCYVLKVGNSLSYTNQIGYRLLAFGFGLIRYGGNVASGIVVVKKNSLQMDYTVHRDGAGRCRVTLDQYRFTELEDAELTTSSPALDELLEDGLFGEDEELLLVVNSVLGLERRTMEEHLQPLCDSPPRPLPLDDQDED